MGFDTQREKKIRAENLQAHIIVQAWKEPSFKQKLLSNPREALLALGMEIPEDISCHILEEPSHTWTLVLPNPPNNIQEMQDQELLDLAFEETHPVHLKEQTDKEESLWSLFSHRFWPSCHLE